MVSPEWGQFSTPNEKEDEIPLTNEASFEEEEKPEPEQKKWGEFQNPDSYQGEPDPTEDESSMDWLMRNITGGAARIGEQYFGRYGDVEKITRSVLKAAPGFLKENPKLGGGLSLLGSAIHELIGQDKWEQLVGDQKLPTSEQLKGGWKDKAKEYLEPKTKGEKIYQDFSSDVGSILPGPGFGRITTPRSFLVNNLGIPAAANTVKQIVEGLGFGEDKADYAKGATWIALALTGNVNAARYASNLMNQGRRGIPTNVHIDVPRFQNRLQQVANDPLLLHADPRTTLARDQLGAIQRDLANGQTSVQSMMTSYDGLNAAKRSRGMFELNRRDRDFARRSIDRVRDALRDEIMDAGSAYPEALNDWRSGVQAWATIHRSRAFTNTISDLARGPYAKILTGPAAGLFGIGALAGAKKPIVAIPAAGAIPAAYKGIQTLYRVWQDPNLANYYWHALSDLARENIPAFIKKYTKLDKGLKESNSSKPKTTSKKD